MLDPPPSSSSGTAARLSLPSCRSAWWLSPRRGFTPPLHSRTHKDSIITEKAQRLNLQRTVYIKLQLLTLFVRLQVSTTVYCWELPDIANKFFQTSKIPNMQFLNLQRIWNKYTVHCTVRRKTRITLVLKKVQLKCKPILWSSSCNFSNTVFILKGDKTNYSNFTSTIADKTADCLPYSIQY
jgi:hypothetical protein